MAYLPDFEGKVKKRILVRKGFWGDHFDELSAIVQGRNKRDIMAPVVGRAQYHRMDPEAQDPEVPNPGSPKVRKGRLPIPIDREAMVALWASDAPLWAVAKAFGVSRNTLYIRARAWGLPHRGTVKTAPKHGGP